MTGGRLTTHVLDLAQGRPAAGLKIVLERWHNDRAVHVNTVITNDDGRTDAPLLPEGGLERGVWELIFHAGDYLRSQGLVAGGDTDGTDGGQSGRAGQGAGQGRVQGTGQDAVKRPGGGMPVFLDIIPIRFTICDCTAHYHVPLLLSPFGYSTYRGS